MKDMQRLLMLLSAEYDITEVDNGVSDEGYNIGDHLLYRMPGYPTDRWTFLGYVQVAYGYQGAWQMVMKRTNLKLRRELL